MTIPNMNELNANLNLNENFAHVFDLVPLIEELLSGMQKTDNTLFKLRKLTELKKISKELTETLIIHNNYLEIYSKILIPVD